MHASPPTDARGSMTDTHKVTDGRKVRENMITVLIMDYGLRTSLAEEIKGQMSIVTVFTRRFGPI